VKTPIFEKNLPLKNKRLLREEFRKGITKVKSFPEELTLATTIRCNKRPPCAMCERNIRKPHLEYDCPDLIIERLKPLFPKLDILYLHCSGEPLIYRKFNELLELIKPPTKIRFNTNGMLLTEEKIKKVVDSGIVDVINFSVDAATEETYAKLRGPHFNIVINNIKNLTTYKKKTKSKKPFIVINMCVMKENFQELPLFIDLAKEVGASSVDFFHLNHGPTWRIKRNPNKRNLKDLFKFLGKKTSAEKEFIFDYREQEKMDPDLHDEMIIKAYEKCEKYGLDMNFVGSVFLSDKKKEKKERVGKKIKETERTSKCIAPWARVVVGVDGNVRMCCYHKEGEDSIGNLNNNSFREIWNGEKAVEIRKEFLQKGHSKFCEKDNSCMFLGRK